MKSISAANVKDVLRDGGEYALLDVREEVDYFPRHMLLASCVPLGRLETMVDDLVPRRTVRVILVDDEDGLATRAASRLAAFGYSEVSVLDGGINAWAEAGNELFSGMHVPSKAFGELVDDRSATPRITAEELSRRLDAGEEVIILDSRPFEDYTRQCIPGGVSCPGGELVFRIYDLVKSPRTLVVVNCAGRTRSIIGAQSLVNAGIRNPVAALTNGTMGWRLAGLELESGATRRAPLPGSSGAARARAAAERVAEAAGVCAVDRAIYGRWLNERNERTTYVFDVRDREEYEAGHLPESVWVPGGQLIQETDRYAATRNARIVLVDDKGVRSRMTGAWLRQLGWRDVHVLDGDFEGQKLATGRRRGRVLGLEALRPRAIGPTDLRKLLDDRLAVVLDFAAAARYRSGHIPGAYFALRASLPGNLSRLPIRENLVVTSSDGLVARFAAAEIERSTDWNVMVLSGGTDAWRKAGFPTAKGDEAAIDPVRELWSPYQTTTTEAQMRAYIDWEVGLMEQVDREGDVVFELRAPKEAVPSVSAKTSN